MNVNAHAGDGGAHVVSAVSEQGAYQVEARAVVLATGSRERGLGALNVAAAARRACIRLEARRTS